MVVYNFHNADLPFYSSVKPKIQVFKALTKFIYLKNRANGE